MSHISDTRNEWVNMWCVPILCFISLQVKSDIVVCDMDIWLPSTFVKMLTRTVLEFLRITSVKGIPRLLRTKRRFMQFIWGLSILCFLVVAAYQSTMLTMAYLEYSTVTSIRELPLDMTGQYEHSIQLPDITFCNVNPFASNFTQATEIPSFEEYTRKVQDMTLCDRCSWDQNISMSRLRDELMTSRGFRIQIGEDKAKNISHHWDTLFTSCTVWVMSGMHPGVLPCERVMRIALHQDSVFYNCFTLRLDVEKIKEMVITGIIIVFHLDDYTINKHQYVLPLHSQIDYINGMMFAFHDRGTIPVVPMDGMILQPGLFSNFKIRVIRRKRLPMPYGRCVQKAGEGNEFITEGSYSQMVCFSLCWQAMVRDLCGCVDYSNFVDVLALGGESVCLKLDRGKDQLRGEWECLQNARKTSAISCANKCPLPCEKVAMDEKVIAKILKHNIHKKMWSDRSPKQEWPL